MRKLFSLLLFLSLIFVSPATVLAQELSPGYYEATEEAYIQGIEVTDTGNFILLLPREYEDLVTEDFVFWTNLADNALLQAIAAEGGAEVHDQVREDLGLSTEGLFEDLAQLDPPLMDYHEIVLAVQERLPGIYIHYNFGGPNFIHLTGVEISQPGDVAYVRVLNQEVLALENITDRSFDYQGVVYELSPED